jgi:small nuclear ribonucleoprotein (snRNP)-like protein
MSLNPYHKYLFHRLIGKIITIKLKTKTLS